MKQEIKIIIMFILGMIIGAWTWSRPLPTLPIEECLPICEQEFERYGC